MLKHYEFRFKAKIKNPPSDEAGGILFMGELIEAIGMKVADLGRGCPNPIAWYSQDPCNQGMTITGILTTSNSAMHIWDKENELQFTLYSCQPFETDKVIDLVDGFVGIEEIIWFDVTDRDTGKLTNGIQKIPEAQYGGMTFG